MSHKNPISLLTLVVLSLAIGMQAEDRTVCSNQTMHGNYGFHATGTAPLVVIGRFTFDGNGGLAGKIFIRVPGKLVGPVEITGTYSVDADCIMTDDWGGGSVHISSIVEHGKAYFIMNTPGTPPIPAAEDSLNNGEGRRQ